MNHEPEIIMVPGEIEEKSKFSNFFSTECRLLWGQVGSDEVTQGHRRSL